MKSKTLILLAVIFLLGILAAGSVYLIERQAAPYQHDYAKYHYGTDDRDKVIDFATQPNGQTNAFISEALLRDRILKQQLAAEGWILREHPYSNGNEMLAYANGRLDVMIIGETPAITAMQLYGFGIYALSRYGNNAVIAKQHITPAQLKGRRVGCPLRTNAHFALEKALKQNGLSLTDIIVVPLKPEETENALRSGQVDAVSIWQPYIAAILQNLPGSVTIAETKTFSTVAVDSKFATFQPMLMKAVLAAVVRAAHWAKQSPDNQRSALEWIRETNFRFTGKSVIDVNNPKWLERLKQESIANPSYPLLPPELKEEQGLLRQQFEFLKRNEIIPVGVGWHSERIHPEVLPDIIRNAQQWQIDQFDYAEHKL